MQKMFFLRANIVFNLRSIIHMFFRTTDLPRAIFIEIKMKICDKHLTLCNNRLYVMFKK